jgi:hypothetical protein
MGEVISFPKIEMPLDLDEEDITAIVEWMRRSEGWGAKFARISHRPGLHDKRWAYLLHCGPTFDACPVITITRTTLEYSVVVWDVLDYLASGTFTAQAASTISEALDIVTEEVSPARSLGIGTAYADSEGGQNANTQFTQTPGFLAQAPVQSAPAVVTAQNGQAVRAYVTQSSHGTWLFPPHQGGGQNG